MLSSKPYSGTSASKTAPRKAPPVGYIISYQISYHLLCDYVILYVYITQREILIITIILVTVMLMTYYYYITGLQGLADGSPKPLRGAP